MTRLTRSAALLLGLAVAVPHVRAEVPKPPDVGRGGLKQQVYQMRSGNKRVKEDPKNRETIKAVCQWLAYSLCQPPFNGEATSTRFAAGTDTPTYLMGEAVSLSDIYSGSTGQPSQEQLEFADEFGKAMAEAVGVVLANSGKPIERINAVRLMAIAARVPAPSLAEPLVAVVNNPKGSDAEKLYAFQGLHSLLEQSDVNTPGRHVFGGIAGAPKLGEIGTALNNYIMQKRTPKDDKERGVIEFVRRHAVAALAQFKDPTVRNAKREVLFRPAWALARVMEQDPSVSPAFTVQEQMEAATGLAHMKVDPDMNLDVAAYSMAKVLVTAARVANVDFTRATDTKTPTLVAWKVAAARWSYALSLWRDGAKSLPATRNPQTLRELCNLGIELLGPLEKEGAGAQMAQGIQAITTWAQNNPPKAWAEMKSATLYKDDPQTVLPFPAAPAPAVDPKLRTPDAKTPPKAAPKAGTPAKKP